MQHDIVFKHDCNAMRITGKSTDSWWSGRTSNPAGVASNPWWVRLPRSSALLPYFLSPRSPAHVWMNNLLANNFYGFESIEATSLALIPLSMRYRLDCCAIKLHLRQWQRFTLTERTQLLHAPFASTVDTQAWAGQLAAILQLRCECQPDRFIDTAIPAWLQMDRWPAELIERCTQLALVLPALSLWQQLAASHRHALCKIARSRHDYVHLPAALREMLIVDDPHHLN